MDLNAGGVTLLDAVGRPLPVVALGLSLEHHRGRVTRIHYGAILRLLESS